MPYKNPHCQAAVESSKRKLEKYRHSEKGILKNRELDRKRRQSESRKRYMKNWHQEHRKLDVLYATITRDKRERNLGHVILWEPKNPTVPIEYHHINKVHVIGIPKELHRSVSHNIFTGKNMEEINRLTFDWIKGFTDK